MEDPVKNYMTTFKNPVGKKTGGPPSLQNLYLYIWNREKERRAEFRKALLPVKISNAVSTLFFMVAAVIALALNGERIARFLSRFTGLSETASAEGMLITPDMVLTVTVVLFVISVVSFLMYTLTPAGQHKKSAK